MYNTQGNELLQEIILRKYKNIPTIINGEKFDSRGEARRWQDLRLMEKAGEITNLTRQVKYDMVVNGVKICTFVPDFEYTKGGQLVTEDFKSKATMTPTFRLKAKLFKALYNREVLITKK